MAAAMPLNGPMGRVSLRHLLAELPKILEDLAHRASDDTQAKLEGINVLLKYDRMIIEGASSLICQVYGWQMGHLMALHLREYSDTGRPSIFTPAYWRWPLSCLEYFFNSVAEFVGERLELIDLTETSSWALDYSFQRENMELSQALAEIYGRPAAMGFNALLAVLAGEGMDVENTIIALVRCEYGTGDQWAILPPIWHHSSIVVSESH
jgi:hypothetical protein